MLLLLFLYLLHEHGFHRKTSCHLSLKVDVNVNVNFVCLLNTNTCFNIKNNFNFVDITSQAGQIQSKVESCMNKGQIDYK